MPTNDDDLVPDEQPDWGLVCSFWTDTDGYTDRDRNMFAAGAEYMQVFSLVRSGWRGMRPIHRENSSRFRMLLGRMRIPFSIENCAAEFDTQGTWAFLTVGEPNADE